MNCVRLCESVIPEVRFFDFAEGKPFVTPRFPHLRFPVHITGFDQDDKWGMLLFKHFVVPSGNLDDLLQGFTVDGSTPLLGELKIDANGIPTGIFSGARVHQERMHACRSTEDGFPQINNNK